MAKQPLDISKTQATCQEEIFKSTHLTCVTFASVPPDTWFGFLQQHAAFSPFYSHSYVTKHVDFRR